MTEQQYFEQFYLDDEPEPAPGLTYYAFADDFDDLDEIPDEEQLLQDPDVCPRCGSWPGACLCYFESGAEE